VTPFKKGAVIALAAAAGLAVLAGCFGLRHVLIGNAKAALQTRAYQKIDIVGVRIPCSGMLDVGIAGVLWAREGEPMAGRLCRALIGSGEWIWYPNHGQPQSAAK
jgi:hypothetical protein